jgi:TPR repeat protein
MLKNILKSTVSSFSIYLSILSPVSAMSDDDLDEQYHCSSSFDTIIADLEEKYNRAKNLELGRGVAQDLDEAKKIYTELIDGPTDVRASLRLGMLYEKDENFTEALKNYEEAWRRDGGTYEKAGMKCAEFYEKGLGTEPDLTEALSIYSEIASTGLNNAYKTEAAHRVELIMQSFPEGLSEHLMQAPMEEL